MNKSFFSFVSLSTLIFLNQPGFVAEADTFLNGGPSLSNQSDQALNNLFKEREFKEGLVKVKVGGEFRYRLEYRDNFNLNNATNEDDAVNLFRTRLNLDIHLGPYLRLFSEGQEAHSVAESGLNRTNAFVNELDLRQLFTEVKSPLKTVPLTVKAGRQELAYGDERLVGAFNWSNVGRVFDAVKVIYLPKEWFQLDLFTSRVVRVEKDKVDTIPHSENFYGIYSTLKPIKDHILDAFLFIRHNRDESLRGERSGEFGQLKEYTMGNRFKGKRWDFDYGTEYALQFGSRAHDTIIAWAFHQELGYTFSKLFWTPRLNIEYNHASGDRNPTDGTFSTFDNLFPTNHDKYGYIDFLSLKNMNDIKVGVGLKPHKKLSFSTDFHWFFLDAKESAWFNAGGGVFRAANPNASTQLGEELDLLVAYKLTEHLNFLIGYSHFFTGPFAKDTGAHDDANFFYIQSALKI